MHKIRQQKVESLIKREISTIILREIKDPRVKFVSVNEVSMTKDMKIAHVYVSVMADTPEDRAKGLEGLNSASGFIRHLIGEEIRLRYLPQLIFKFDESREERERVLKIFKEMEDKKE